MLQRGLQCIGRHQLGAAGIDEQGLRFHAGQVIGRNDAARRIVQAQVQCQHICFRKKSLL
ncbi:hypothetical protein D3C81_2188020 [compost metagenome]